MVGQQTLALPVGVRVLPPQPIFIFHPFGEDVWLTALCRCRKKRMSLLHRSTDWPEGAISRRKKDGPEHMVWKQQLFPEGDIVNPEP